MTRIVAMLGTIVLVLSLDAQAQVPEDIYSKIPGRDYSTLAQDRQDAARGSEAYLPQKRPGHYTVQDWRALIDSLWGPGPPTATKLQIFDFFWDLIDKQYAGFPNLAVNWDSLKAVYRPEIAAGVSRGRFWGIMGRMYMSLQEIHTWMSDLDLDAYFKEGGRLVYNPGIPAFFVSGWGWAGSFGAALTPLPDSSLLVYKALPGHPLGIVPGDIVLGYDRIPWKQLYPELISVEFPIEWWGETCHGSSPRSMTHGLLGSAGSNWGLFDTVDVVKYSTGDTVHLPTAPLASLDYLSLFATEQVAVPGVKMPDYAKGERITWGVVDGTSVGYIYAYCWDAAVGPVFESAVRDLVTVKKVIGLVLDFRYNVGSKDSWTAANAGLDYLFNEDPIDASRAQTATRVNPGDHFGFTFSPPPGSFQPRPDYYDRPIAVLTGPQAMSVGDHVAFRMRSHPMVRFFGLPTNGAFIIGGPWETGPVYGNWYYRYAAGQLKSLVNNEGFLMHKSFPVDEEVWLTRDRVAMGEDDVVKRAIEWITALTYGRDLTIDRVLPRPGFDTVTVTAVLTNPLNHTAALSALVTVTNGTVLDSIPMFDDGAHGDLSPNDSLWGCRFVAPTDEDFYRIGLRTDDLSEGSYRRILNIAPFTTAGPLSLDSLAYSDYRGRWLMMAPYVRNNGQTTTIKGTQIVFKSNDPCVNTKVSPPLALLDIPPGEVRSTIGGSTTSISYDSSKCPGYIDLAAEMSVGGITYWIDSVRVSYLITGVPELASLPTAFRLEQNYPNPFNPSTNIKYELPKSSVVRLSVFDMLGREVSVLVNESRDAGVHEAKLDGSTLASGMYFYRLQAGDFVQTKKLLIVR